MNARAIRCRLQCLTCVDDFTKEYLTVIAAFGISGIQVTRILDSIALFRGYPATIRTDQGPEFICRALDQWTSGPVDQWTSGPVDQWTFEDGVEGDAANLLI